MIPDADPLVYVSSKPVMIKIRYLQKKIERDLRKSPDDFVQLSPA